MSKLKIEIGVSRIERVKLQASIDYSTAKDIDLLAEWSNNEKNYVINELLRFAITQAEGFQEYKTKLTMEPPEPLPISNQPPLALKPESEIVSKSTLSLNSGRPLH
jgi:hypothetical protein